LFVFTDGIPEALNNRGELYSDERLEEFVLQNRNLPPDQLSDAIMKEIRGYIGDNPRSDDITMLILRRIQ